MDPAIVHALQMALLLVALIFWIVIGMRLASKFLGTGERGKRLGSVYRALFTLTMINLYMLNPSMGMRRGM